MINVIIAGITGRMGRNIAEMVEQHPRLQLAAAFEAAGSTYTGRDAGEVLFGVKNGIIIADTLDAVIDRGDVIIDFTFHTATVQFARIAAQYGTAMVIGTTGLSTADESELRQLAEQKFPCVYAPNMSVCVNVLFQLVRKTAAVLGEDFDIEIVEAHHNRKKDAPSGTALKLAEMAATGVGSAFPETVVCERNGVIGERCKGEIGIQSIRAADIVGEHTVYFAGSGERIELSHRAHSREHFARGATRAAAWIVGRENGLYTMVDVLELENF